MLLPMLTLGLKCLVERHTVTILLGVDQDAIAIELHASIHADRH